METRLTLKPGQKGTKRLVARYGDQLVRVRYRYDPERNMRYTTVELIVDRIAWTPSKIFDRLDQSDLVRVKVFYREAARTKVWNTGGRWLKERKLWELPRARSARWASTTASWETSGGKREARLDAQDIYPQMPRDIQRRMPACTFGCLYANVVFFDRCILLVRRSAPQVRMSSTLGNGNSCGAARVGSVGLVTSRSCNGTARGSNWKAPHHRGIKPSALRSAIAEASMNVALSSACEVGSDHAAPRCASLRLAPGIRYAERVWSMQAFGLVGRMSHRSTEHRRPNPPFNRSANGVAVGTRRALRAGARLMASRLGLSRLWR